MSGTLYLPKPLPHQRPVLDHPSKRKLWRAGRRTGKTRCALLAAVDGHGPRSDGEPQLPGILQGGDILWLSPDYPQSAAIWREEILQRFAGLPGVEVALSDRRVAVHGLGTLELRSAEAIDGVRGRRFSGVIVDEAAFLDLEQALNAVILPTLVDRDGWLFVIGSPNGGHDGNSAKRVPSYFNLLCEEVDAGSRRGWASWHNRTEDNQTLSRAVIAALRAEYPEGSLTAQQELDALLVAGGGRFYPELLEDQSRLWTTVDKQDGRWALPDWCEFWGGYDWGYSHPATFVQVVRQGNTVTVLDTLHMHKYQDEEQAAHIKGWADPRCLATVYAGHDAFAKRMAHSAAAETVADVMDRYGISLGRANVDREAGAKTLRRLLSASSKAVTLKINDTPGNRRAIDELAKLVPDPLNLNVPAKRDADERGLNGDDAADGWRYALVNVGSEAVEPIRRTERSNVTDGRDDQGDDFFEPQRDRTRGGWTVAYEERPPGPDGQFAW